MKNDIHECIAEEAKKIVPRQAKMRYGAARQFTDYAMSSIRADRKKAYELMAIAAQRDAAATSKYVRMIIMGIE